MAASFSDCRAMSDILFQYADPAVFTDTPHLFLEVQKAPVSFAPGTGSGQCSQLYASQGRSLSSASSETLNLASLTDPLGNAIDFTKVNAVEIVANPNNTTVLTVGAAGSNPFLGPMGGTAPTVALNPGDHLLWINAAAGWSTTSATNLKVANASGAAATYDIKIIG